MSASRVCANETYRRGECSPTADCQLNMTTVTQNIYTALDPLDVALYPVPAVEMRAKFNSRQFVYTKAGIKGMY